MLSAAILSAGTLSDMEKKFENIKELISKDYLSTNALSKANGGTLTTKEALSDGVGVAVVSSFAGEKSSDIGEKYKLLRKYGEAAETANTDLLDYVIANGETEDQTVAQAIKNVAASAGSIIKCGPGEGVTRAELVTMINNDEDVTQVCTSNITDMSRLFRGNKSFNQDISNWDTSNVTTMFGMFYGANAFNQPIGKWDVSKVTNMKYLFVFARDFNQPLNDWNVSNVTNMYDTFDQTGSFNQPLDKWDTGNVTTMFGTFYGAKAFNQDISNWDTSKVVNYSYWNNYIPKLKLEYFPHF